METMVSNSNNIEQVIYLWQDLVLSIQPEGLFSTKSLIVISIVIFLIMTWLKEKKKEKEEKHYYNNLLNGFLTILLTIIFGKGLEILFRILHIICSGAYGNVVFSLNDIFISLLFGCIFVISGSLLLFNKKFYKQVRHQTIEDAKLEQENAKLEQENENLSKIVNDLETSLNANLEEMKAVKKAATENELQINLNAEFEKMVARIKKIVGFIQKTMDGPEIKLVSDHVKNFHLKELEKALEKIMNNPEEIVKTPDGFFKITVGFFYLQDILDLFKHEEENAGLEAIIAGFEAIITEFEAYKAVEKVKLKAVELEKNMAKLAADEEV
ncbi:hypothetical protein GINT2_001088 [Glugoides intestinalis]